MVLSLSCFELISLSVVPFHSLTDPVVSQSCPADAMRLPLGCHEKVCA